jgi:small subunit ribosomal protein S21
MRTLREKKQFTKPSVLRRKQIQKAQYVQAIRTAEEKG